MKRKSDTAKHSLPQSLSANNLESQFVRRQNKRTYSIFKPSSQQFDDNTFSNHNKNQFQVSQAVVNRLLNEIINNLEDDIQKIEMRRVVRSVIQMTNLMTFELYKMQYSQQEPNQISTQPEKQPIKNMADPIGGFYKQSFIRKPVNENKKPQQMSIIMLKEISKAPSTTKKLPSLLKQLSEKKIKNQGFIPLQDNLDFKPRKASMDFQQLIRQRLLKQIENRKFKQKIEAISTGTDPKGNTQKKNCKSAYENGDKMGQNNEVCNFDYDGNKIQVLNIVKVKSNIKILKPLYKLTKQKPDQKLTKLQKKFHQRISFVPRGSRNCLQFNNKAINNLADTYYTDLLKEKLQSQLRKTEIKFLEKQFNENQRERQKRQSLIP